MEFSPFVSKIIKTIIYAFIFGIIKQTGGVNNCGERMNVICDKELFV